LTTQDEQRVLATSLQPEEEMTTIATTIKPRVTVRERLRRIGMAMYGPADMGPYGPSVPPPPDPGTTVAA